MVFVFISEFVFDPVFVFAFVFLLVLAGSECESNKSLDSLHL